MSADEDYMTKLREYHKRIAEAQGRQTAANFIRAAATCYVGGTLSLQSKPESALAYITEAERHAAQLESSTVSRPVWRQWLRDWGYATGGVDD